MKLEEAILKIEKDEEPKGLGNIIFNFSVRSSDLLFIPSNNEEYNEKHRLECVIFSSVTHILFVEALYPKFFQKVRTSLIL